MHKYQKKQNHPIQIRREKKQCYLSIKSLRFAEQMDGQN